MKIPRSKLCVVGLVIVLIAVIAMGYAISVSMQRASVIEIYKSELRDLTEQKAEQINQFLEGKARELDILMSFEEFTEVLRDPTNSVKLAQAQDRINDLRHIIPGISLLTNDGIVIVGDVDLPGTDYSAQPYFSMEEKALTFERYYDPLRKNDYYAAVSPFYDRQDIQEIIGVIAIDIPLDELSEILIVEDKAVSTELYLVDSDKIIITNSIFGYTPFAQEADTEIMADCFACMEEHSEDGEIIEHEEAIEEYLDYRGVEVFGAHAYVTAIKACLIGEMDKADIVSSSGRDNVFSDVYHAAQHNKAALSAIYLFLAILIIWWTTTHAVLKSKVVKYLPLMVFGMAVCMHAAYAYLATQQNTGALQVFQLSVFLISTILLMVAEGQVISFRLFKTQEGMSKRYSAVMLIFAVLAFVYMGFEFRFHLYDSGSTVAVWGHLLTNVILIFYGWWVLYLLRKKLHAFSTWSLLFFSTVSLIVIVTGSCIDNHAIDWLHALAIGGISISAYFMAIHRLANITEKYRNLDEI